MSTVSMRCILFGDIRSANAHKFNIYDYQAWYIRVERMQYHSTRCDQYSIPCVSKEILKTTPGHRSSYNNAKAATAAPTAPMFEPNP